MPTTRSTRSSVSASPGRANKRRSASRSPARSTSATRREPSIAGIALKDDRSEHGLSQEQLAEELGIEPRTLRRYETGERALDNVVELRRIAETVGLSPDRLGLAPVQESARTPAQIDAVVERVWTLVEASRMVEATNVITRLIDDTRTKITREDPDFLRSLAHAYHAAGYVAAVSTRAHEAHRALPAYHEVEVLGRAIEDPTLINIGLTYQGDMHQRRGDVTTALTYLEAARDVKGADNAAMGNGIQLLGRAYLRMGNLGAFERAMAQSEEMTALFDPANSSTRGHYNLGTVYEEYGRGYAGLGVMPKALDYLDRAQAALPATTFWELLIATARAIALVKGGELRAGVDLAVSAAEQCRATGNIRFLDRVYIIQAHLDQMARDIATLASPLREALHGGPVIEY
jgi:transcriptional regulator with XRE-family HTH domain